LQKQEGQPEPETDPHANGRPKLFMDQPETGYPVIDTELKRAHEQGRFTTELTPDIVKRQSENPKRLACLLEMDIPIKEEEKNKTPRVPYRKMTFREQEECKKVIEKYLETGVIRPSASPYGAAVLFAPKKNGTLRFCVDWRPLNAISTKNSAHPPDAADCIAQLSGASIFSTCDAAAGYHQFPVTEKDKEKTAFNTKYGHYEFNLVSFGLCNAPAFYVSAMNKIFSGEMFRTGLGDAHLTAEQKKVLANVSPEQRERLGENFLDKFICVYIDDIIIYSKNPEEHAKHLRKVFDRLIEFDLVLSSPKCFFAQDSVEYLGHIISKEGVHVNPEKVKAVRDWPVPATQTDVRQFLGLCGYYRKFIKNYGQIAKPLTDLTAKDAAADTKGTLKTWSDAAQAAFETLRNALCEAPVLAIPNPSKGGFHLMTDASVYGLGATLFQEGAEDGKLHPCAYASRVLTPTERKNYEIDHCVYELELKALMYGLEKWKMFLDGQIETTVETDHKSLIWLQSQKELSPRQGRFLDELARYGLKIKYLKGELNVVADALSRNPQFKKIIQDYNNTEPSHTALAAAVASTTEARWDDVPAYGQRDASLDAWYARFSDAYAADPAYRDRKEAAPFIKTERKGKTLWYHTTEGDDRPPTLCVPNDSALKRQIVQEFHAPPTAGHRHAQQVFMRVRQSYYWEKMTKNINEWVKACEICQKYKRNRRGKAGHMAPLEMPSGPWSSLVIDFCGPFNHKSPNGKTERWLILVVCDRLTKMAHFIPCREDINAAELADIFLENVIKLHGLPEDIRSDRGSLFTGHFWDRLWTRLGTSLSLATAFHHQTAGQAERAVQDLKIYLRANIKEHTEWKRYLPLAEFAYNSAEHSAIGCCPFELNAGFRPKNPADLLSPEPPEVRNPTAGSNPQKKKKQKEADAWLTQVDTLLTRAKRNIAETHRVRAEYYDKFRRPVKDTQGNIKFAPKGSMVYLASADLSNETAAQQDRAEGHVDEVQRMLLARYLGPYRVAEVCGKAQLNRRLELPDDLKSKLKSDVFHVDRIKEAFVTDEKFEIGDTLPPPALREDGASDDEPEYSIEAIEAWREDAKGRWFYVKYTGYSRKYNQWQHQENLPHAQKKIKEFMETNPRPTTKERARRPVRPSATARRTSRRLRRTNAVTCMATVSYRHIGSTQEKPIEISNMIWSKNIIDAF
jgi:hypothetical protein